jgi:hypothetical protein
MARKVGSSGPPIVQVQASATVRGGPVSSFVYTWSTAPTVGNKVIIAITTWQSVAGPTVTATDSAGNTYTVRATSVLGATRTTILEATIASVPTTTTLTFSASGYYAGNVSEWSGLASYDTNATASGGAPVSGAQTYSVGPTSALSLDKALVITSFGAQTGTTNIATSAPSGYTGLSFEQNSSAYIGFGAAYKTVASAAAVSAAWPVTANSGSVLVAAIAVFIGS